MCIIDLYMKKLLGLFKKWFGSSKGFTLIELLVVIAIIGVLLVGSIVSINPVQKINQAKDANGKAAVDQIASALQAYYTSSSNPTYPATLDVLAPSTGKGELRSLPNDAFGNKFDSTTTSGYNVTTACADAVPCNASLWFTLKHQITDTANFPTCSETTPCTIWCWQTSTGKAAPMVGTAAPDTACNAP